MDEKIKRGGALRVALRLLILLALYPLSLGPLIWLANCDAFSESTAEYLVSIYFPLLILIDNVQNPILLKICEQYFGWWDALPRL